jgi:Nucleoside-diphosphate-sugar epimerases
MGIFNKKRILVTGGSGFIASHLCNRLLNEGATVYITTKYFSIIDNIRLANIWNEIHPIEADLRNPDSLKKLKEIKPDIIYHLAAYNHVGDSFINISEAIDSNCKGTVNLMESYKEYERFIYISSSEAYGSQTNVPFSESMSPFPISPYAIGKYSGELYSKMMLHVYKLPIVILRPFNAFGPFQSPRAVIAELILKCLAGEDILITEGIQTRDFNYVENLIDGFILAGWKQEALGEIINIGSGEEISIKSLTMKIHKLANSKSHIQVGALPYRPTEIWRMFADNKKAKKLLDWTPNFTLEEGLIKSIKWYIDYKKFIENDFLLKKLCQGGN